MKRSATAVAVALLLAACGGDAGTDGDDAAAAEQVATTDDGAGDEADDTAGDTDDDVEVESAEPNGPDDGEPAPVSESVATVTLDGTTHEFRPGGFTGDGCGMNDFGTFGVTLHRVDDTGEIVAPDLLGMNLLPPGLDPESAGFEPLMTVTIEGTTWSADPSAGSLSGYPTPGTGRIDDYTIDGPTASGTATFFDSGLAVELRFANGDPDMDTVSGTFEVACAE